MYFRDRLFISLIALFPLLLPAEVTEKDQKQMQTPLVQVLPQNTRYSDKALFQLLPYKPSYFVPFYLQPALPNKDNLEVSFQISVKALIWYLSYTSTNIYAAYTQQSYWRAYADSAYFRSSEYQPEIFIYQKLGWGRSDRLGGFKIKALKAALIHHSNGEGGLKERSWNRFYLEIQLAFNKFELHAKPWHILETPDLYRYNPDIKNFHGYGRVSLSTSYKQHKILVTFYKKAFRVRYMFPWTPSLIGIVQYFHGNGPNLLQYNQTTNSIGIGLAINS